MTSLNLSYAEQIVARNNVLCIGQPNTLKTICEFKCRKHLEVFSQRVDSILSGNISCPSCKREKTLERSKELFLKKASKKYNNRFIYDLSSFSDQTSYISFTDNTDVNVTYKQRAIDHLKSLPTKLLSRDKLSIFTNKLSSDLEYISGYENLRSLVLINCKTCNSFFERRASRVLVSGCPACSTSSKRTTRLSQETFITKIQSIHKEYSFKDTLYTNTDTPVRVICKEHGSFLKTPKLLTQGFGCNMCRINKSERELVDFIKEQLPDIEVQVNIRPSWLSRKELDIYIPSLNLAIEYNGTVFHHSSPSSEVYGKFAKDKSYHYNKWKLCHENNVTLFSIYDFYWKDPFKKEIYKSKLKHYLKLDDRVFARKCSLVTVPNEVAYDFYEKYHLEGRGFNYKDSLSVALKNNDEIVMVGTLGSFYDQSTKTFKYKLHRICTKDNTTVVGGISRLAKYFRKTKGPFIYSITLATGGSTLNCFVTKTKVTERYFWVCPKTLKYYHRNYTQKSLLEKHFKQKIYENDTEVSYMERLGFLRIYDNGIINLKHD